MWTRQLTHSPMTSRIGGTDCKWRATKTSHRRPDSRSLLKDLGKAGRAHEAPQPPRHIAPAPAAAGPVLQLLLVRPAGPLPHHPLLRPTGPVLHFRLLPPGPPLRLLRPAGPLPLRQLRHQTLPLLQPLQLLRQQTQWLKQPPGRRRTRRERVAQRRRSWRLGQGSISRLS